MANNSLDEMNEVILKAFKEEYGEDARLEDGETVVFELENCLCIWSLEDGNFRQEFIGGKPIKVDYKVPFYIDGDAVSGDSEEV